MFVRIVTAALLCGIVAGCSASSTGPKKPAEQSFTLFVLTELRGTIEPCGCSSDPLGDIARTVALVESVRQGGRPALVVDAGSLLFTEPSIPEHLDAQETLKARLIRDVYTTRLRAAAIGLGPYDLGKGVAAIELPRQAANVADDSGIALEPPKIVDAGGAKVGIFGVVAADALVTLGVQAGDAQAAVRTAVERLRQQGAELVIGLAHMTQRDAAALARAVPGIDILVVGQNAPEPPEVKAAPIQVGDTYLVSPANRGQVITRLDITMRGGDRPLVDAIGEARAAVDIAVLGEQIERLEGDLARWRADPTADAAFVEARARELAELEQARAALRASPRQIPDKGSFFTMEQVKIKKALPCHAEVQASKQAFDKAAGQANVEAAGDRKAPPPAEGQAGYVGIEGCADCHDEAVEFWKKTSHAKAWETLEKVGKELDYSCISCHVTGWDKPGGATLAHNQGLRDVQCEVCHGPGSIHVAEDGDPEALVRTPAEAVCVACHNQEHSDTFQYEAYLRDITGVGHGEDFRAELGDGPTGHELRSEALEKAGRSLGANCLK